MKKISKTIEQDLVRQIKQDLADIDIDGTVLGMLKKKKIQERVKEIVYRKIAETIQESAWLKIKRSMPIIDVYTEEKVKEFLHSIGLKS